MKRGLILQYPEPGWASEVIGQLYPGVSDWTCAHGCLVRALDLQSGLLKSGLDRSPTPERVTGFFGSKMAFYSASANYGDSGGASRFFPQFGSEAELDEWLLRLLLG